MCAEAWVTRSVFCFRPNSPQVAMMLAWLQPDFTKDWRVCCNTEFWKLATRGRVTEGGRKMFGFFEISWLRLDSGSRISYSLVGHFDSIIVYRKQLIEVFSRLIWTQYQNFFQQIFAFFQRIQVSILQPQNEIFLYCRFHCN